MTTPLESVLTHTLDAAARAAPEPAPDLFQGVNGLLKRRRRQRHLAAASAATAVAVVTVAAVAMVPAAPPQGDAAIAFDWVTTAPATAVTDGCTVRALPAPKPWSEQQPLVRPTGVDPSGRYVTGYAAAGQVSLPLLWVDGELRILNPPGGTVGTSAVAGRVNAAGTVVGWSSAGGWVYRNGQFSQLPALPDDLNPALVNPIAINDRGDIVGHSGPRVVIWPADQPGQVRPIGDVPPTTISISNDGLIIGNDRNGEVRLWNRDGTVHAHPRGFLPQLVAGPWVLGEVGTPPAPAHPMPAAVVGRFALWNLTTGAGIPLIVDDTVAAYFLAEGLAESGAVLIELITEHGDRPAALRDGKVFLLPLPEGGQFEEIEASAISGDGRTIVGTDSARVLLWRC